MSRTEPPRNDTQADHNHDRSGDKGRVIGFERDVDACKRKQSAENLLSKSDAHSMRPLVIKDGPRRRAFRLGFRFLVAAANPWSGLNRATWQKVRWQPYDPYGLPPWFPAGAFPGRVALQTDDILVMRGASQ